MLGSHFDLDKEVARIALERKKERRDPHTAAMRARGVKAYSEFDRRIRRFLHALGNRAQIEESGSTSDANETANSVTLETKKVRGIAESLTQLR